MTQNCPSSRCSKRNGQRGTDDCPLLVQPPSAGFDFTGIGLGMQPSLAPLFEFEMLDRIGDIDLRPVDSRLAERSVEDLTRRTNERLSCQIFPRSEEHTSELQSLMRISYAVFCLKKKNKTPITYTHTATPITII